MDVGTQGYVTADATRAIGLTVVCDHNFCISMDENNVFLFMVLICSRNTDQDGCVCSVTWNEWTETQFEGARVCPSSPSRSSETIAKSCQQARRGTR